MPDPRFRITYSIEQIDGNGDYGEIGFGSTGEETTVDAALYQVQSVIQNRQWETTPGMPDPQEVDRG